MEAVKIAAVEEFKLSDAYDDNNTKYFLSGFELLRKKSKGKYPDFDFYVFQPYEDDDSMMPIKEGGDAAASADPQVVPYACCFVQAVKVVCEPYTCCFVQVFRVVLTLVVFVQAVKVVCEPYTCCFVQVCRVVLTLVVLFKRLRLFASLTLVVLFKCLGSSLRLLFRSSVKVVCEPYTCCFVQVFRVVLTLVVSFKRLRLFVSLTLVVLFKCLGSSLRLLFRSSG
uniref:Uncharacterized protein n=1 Tax=Fagus sylvatica TaxID=28930 RepID=A0A2N9EFB1_FAGSY